MTQAVGRMLNRKVIMLTLEEISALRVCVGAAIGEFGASETTDLALSALAKIEAAQQSVQRTACPVCRSTEEDERGLCAGCGRNNQ